MTLISKKLVGLLLIAFVFTLAACNGQPSEPTVNPDSIYTAAAITVEAQLTQATAENPTATFTQSPPTETVAAPQQGQTQSSGQDATAQANQPGQPVATSTTLVLSTFTASPPPPSSAKAQYELVSQDPSDGTVLPQGYRFDMSWTIKNTGTETWTEQYTIEFFIGDRIGGDRYTTNRYNFREAVEPGDSTVVIVDMKTPYQGGELYSWWKIKDETGSNFGDLDVQIVVQGSGSTATTAP